MLHFSPTDLITMFPNVQILNNFHPQMNGSVIICFHTFKWAILCAIMLS